MPLNPSLYEMLQQKFGDVRVSNAGEQRLVDYSPEPNHPGRLRTKVRQRGEQYAINCPCCSDSRHRCYISYQYGERDPRTGSPNHHLWFCHNDQCHRDQTNRVRLQAMVTPSLAGQARARRKAAASTAAAPPAPLPIIAPEGRTPVDQLPPDHPASRYLIERGFDIGELSAVWGVCMIDSCRDTRPNATGRIAFPILRPEPMFSTSPSTATVLAGWQARIVPGIQPAAARDAKYLSAAGMQKSAMLYGLPQATQTTGQIAVVEGPTDVWRYGSGAVALLGKDMSPTQRGLLSHYFAGRPIIVMLDGDAQAAAEKIQRELQAARGHRGGDERVVIARLPEGRDPADLTREQVQSITVAALRAGPATIRHPGAAMT